MSGLLRRWVELFRALGDALLDLLEAELRTLSREIARSGRHLGVAIAFFGGAAAIAFWLLGVLTYFAIALLSLWLPMWGAALIVAGVLLLAVVVVAWLGVSRLRRVENPATIFRRRLDDHLGWWNGRLLAEEPGGEDGGEGAEADLEEELP
jgi:uncharacterized membrane-anchored protein